MAAYRRPVVAGILLGLAAGVIYYPLFLLPLWIGFYWQRGLVRFLSGFVAVLLLLAATLVVGLYPRILTDLILPSLNSPLFEGLRRGAWR